MRKDAEKERKLREKTFKIIQKWHESQEENDKMVTKMRINVWSP